MRTGFGRRKKPVLLFGFLRLLLLLLALAMLHSAGAQTFTFSTIAGTPGQSGSSDGTNNAARFFNPSSIALDNAGTLFVADALNHIIRKVTRAGTNWVVTTIAGLAGQSGTADGTNSGARFNRPRGIAVDSAGTLFVVDNRNNAIRKVAPDGTNWVVITIAGAPGQPTGFSDGSGTNALFNLPMGVATSPSGSLFVADSNNHIIRQAELAGEEWSVTTLAGFPGYPGWIDGTGTDAEFSSPFALMAVDATNVFISDTGNNAIRQMELTAGGWKVTTIAGLLNSPNGSADGDGAAARFYFPAGIARDGTGLMYVADQQNHTLRLLSPTNNTWRVSTIAGQPLQSGTNDGVGADARFQKPWGVAVDASGVLYVADHSNHTIRRGVPSGAVVTAPTLNVVFTTNTIVLSWPLSAANFLLETAPSLESGVQWTEVIDGIVTTTDSFVLSKANAGVAGFYRLRQR